MMFVKVVISVSGQDYDFSSNYSDKGNGFTLKTNIR